MRVPRLSLLFPLLLSLMLALAACGGDEALSDEEYFQRMDEIDKDLDARFDEVFGGSEEESAAEVKDKFAQTIDYAREQYGGVKPPSELEDEHNELLDAIDNYGDKLDATEVATDASFEEVFGTEEVSAAEERINDAFCVIQDAAGEKNIEVDVGCERQVDPATIPAEETTEVLIQDFAFDPPHIQVAVGATVTWTQGTDEEPHTATADDETFDSGVLEEGDTFPFTFEEAGEFSYFCEIHPEMLGLVTVTE
jgi:plastocyanin